MSWTTKKLVTVGGFVGLSLTLWLIIAMPLVLIFGPFMGGPVSMFLLPMLFILCGRIIPEKGSILLMALIVGIVALALPLLGPPGLFIKLPIILLFGLVAEAVEVMMRRSLPSALLSGSLSTFSLALVTVYLAPLFGISSPAIEKLLMVMLLLALIEGALAGLAAHHIFEKIKDRRIVKSFRE